jgi:hypothetical protein
VEYWVSHKRINQEETRIERVMAMMVTVNGLSLPLAYDRKDVIQGIQKGDNWCTCLQKDESWIINAEIHVVEVDGEYFIRTDGNNIKSDNLGELPEF